MTHLLAAADSRPDALQSFDVPTWLWLAFLAGVVALLLLDLFVLHRDAHEISLKEAAWTSSMWIAIGVAFTAAVWLILGNEAGLQYITGYLIEKSLSVDNVFVWAAIFGYFAVPGRYQHRVLFWGIFGALVLRAIFIFAGVALLDRLEWLLFVFGGLLLYSAWRIVTHDVADVHPERNPVLRLVRRFIPVTATFHGQKLFTRENARLLATPLFVVLILIEAADVVFAVDSVPAILAISRDPFVVFSSNAMAILGLRALYFLLAGAKERLVYLNEGLGVILAFVGVKMIISRWIHIDSLLSLAFIGVVLVVTVVASLRSERSVSTPTDAS